MIGVMAASYVVVACLFASFGFLLCGIMTSAKISDLYRRIALAEEGLERRTGELQELTAALRLLLSEIEKTSIESVSHQTIQRATDVLSRA